MMAKNAIAHLALVLCIGAWLGCSQERVASPVGDPGTTTGPADNSALWLQVAPDRASVYVFLRGKVDPAHTYVLERADSDTSDYRDVSFTLDGYWWWSDTNVAVGRTYHYRVRAFNKGVLVGSTPVATITCQRPWYAVRQLEQAYNKRDLGLLEKILDSDYTYDGVRNDRTSVTFGRDLEVAVHRKMFDPAQYDTGLKNLTLSISNITAERIEDEEDYLGFLCFELVADVDLRLDFDQRLTSIRPTCYKGTATFKVRHSAVDPTQWVIYEWTDPK